MIEVLLEACPYMLIAEVVAMTCVWVYDDLRKIL